MSNYSISVVTPSYNQAEFIVDTLDSVARQTYNSVEHIVMDGGSSDGTIDILEEYERKPGYDLHWVSESDEGQSDAINKGFERASGDIVAWLNSDDVYFDVDVLARVNEYFDRYDADIIYGDLAYIDKSSTVTSIDVRPDFDASKLPYRILVGQPATFFRDYVVEAEKLDTKLRYSMDYEYWLRLSQTFSFEHVDDVLAGFRSYEEQKSQDQQAMAAEMESVFDEYEYPRRSDAAVITSNIRTEAGRLMKAFVETTRLSRDTPELAFDGEFAPSLEMLRNVGPGVDDVRKAWNRWATRGASG